ncbi:MAG TPA: PIN domain-containing protein, partial [Burkholderiaceae bacterium]|nr:PIN domain-containing protein [Burkholderiaceae bacterium]
THVLIDWENVQPKDTDVRALVPEATDLWLFHGPDQKGVGAHHASFGDRATPVRVARAGKNALDFHLSFYLGYIASKQPDARFVAISNDKGYGPMLEHAQSLGFTVEQLQFGGSRRKVPAKKAATRKSGSTTSATEKVTVGKVAAKKSSAKKTTATKATTTKTAPAGTTANAVKAAKTTKAVKAEKAVKTAKTVKAAKTAGAANSARTAAPSPPALGQMKPVRKTLEQLAAMLKKTPAANRPLKEARLRAYIASRLGAGAMPLEADAVLDQLRARGWVTVDDRGSVTYTL